MDSVQLLLYVLVFLVLVTLNSGSIDDRPPAISPQKPYEYCSGEEFRPSCSNSNEVIVINEATYGRGGASTGRCFMDDEQQMGCIANYTEHLDALCSGRRSCIVRVPSTQMDKVNRCPQSMPAALYASYKCVKVAGGSCQSCHTSGHVQLSDSRGYLASIVTAETESREGCGSARCPWLIQVSAGQTINLTLFDFSVAQQQQQQQQQTPQQRSPGVPSSATDRCRRLLVIKERANPKTSPICGGRVKQRHLYMSVSHFLEVHVISDSVTNDKGQFLIYYEAVGCPDVVPPKYSRMKRMHNQCEIDCPGTSSKWILNCVDNQWVGEFGTCPPPYDDSVRPEKPQKQSPSFWSILSSLPLNVLIALVVAVTVIIGVIIITTGVVCLKKNRYKSRRPDSAIYTGASSEFEFRQDLVGPNSALVPKTNAPTASLVAPQTKPRRPSTDLLMPVRDNTYAVDRCMESRPLPAIPDGSQHGSTQRDNINRVMVQVHPNVMSSETVNSNQTRPTIVCRGGGGPAAAGPRGGGGPRDDHRVQPHASPGHRGGHGIGGGPPGASGIQGDNHHYFILDPDVLVEEPAMPCSGQSSGYQSSECQTQSVPLSHQNSRDVHESSQNRLPAGQCNSSANGIQLRPIRDGPTNQQKKTNTQSSSSNNSGIGSWP